jgi:hypothetical protein
MVFVRKSSQPAVKVLCCRNGMLCSGERITCPSFYFGRCAFLVYDLQFSVLMAMILYDFQNAFSLYGFRCCQYVNPFAEMDQP